MEKAPLARFHLAEGENKILDINTWKGSGVNQGLLSVQVPVPGASVERGHGLAGQSTGRIDPVLRTDREQVLIARRDVTPCMCPRRDSNLNSDRSRSRPTIYWP